MDVQDRLFGEIAVRLRLMSREQVSMCIHHQQSEVEPRRIGEVATELGYMSDDQVALTLSHQTRILERRRQKQEGAKGEQGKADPPTARMLDPSFGP